MSGATRALVGVCFFGSGAAGLVYEVLWSRHLRLLFGSTTLSVSVVLATFMAGLGLGSRLLGRAADRTRSPLRLYALCELGIGVYALLTAPLLALAHAAHASMTTQMTLTPSAQLAVKIVLSALVLLPPATLMGGTLPALLRAVSDSPERARRTVGLLYGLNTLGAVAGTLATGLVLIEVLGMSTTMSLAAVANLGIGALMYLRARSIAHAASTDRERSAEPAAESSPVAPRSPGERFAAWFCAVGLFASGAITMQYEVIFTRLLGTVFGVSSYAFSLVLGVFLGGLALGGLVQAALARRRPPTTRDFAWVQLGVAVLGLAATWAMPLVPRAIVYVRQIPGLSFEAMLSAKALIAAVFLLPLSLVAGMGVPLLVGVLAREIRVLGTVVGDAYLINTTGTIAGSLAAGFVLVSSLGSEWSLRATSLMSAALAVVGLLDAWALVPIAVAAVTVLLPRWPIEVHTHSDTSARAGVATRRMALEQRLHGMWREPLFFEEGREATVAVFSSALGRTLVVNGHPDASDGADMATQAFLSVVPLAVRPAARDVLIVGFGSGVSADVAARAPGVERVDVVEIEPAVLAASPWFAHVNHAAERNPKIRVLLEDARSYATSTPRRYDVIISEPSNPWRAGVASLFSQDFYQSARARLQPGGVFAQWMQLYGLDAPALRLIVSTFASVFATVDLWWLDDGNVVLIGRDEEAPMRASHVETLVGAQGVFAEEMKRYWGGARPGMLYARLLLGTAGIRRLLGDASEVNTDDLPLLEYEAPRAVFRSDGRHAERLLAAKLLSGSMAPVLDGPPPDAAAVWVGVAQMHLEARLQAEALAAIERALQHQPTADTLAYCAWLLLQAGAPEPAALRAGEALAAELAPDARLLALRTRGLALLRMGRAAEAAAQLAELDRDPAGAITVDRFDALVRSGDDGGALAQARRILEATRPGGEIDAPQIDHVLGGLGRIGDRRAGIRLIEEALREDSGVTPLIKWRTLASLYELAGDCRGALAYVDRIAVAGPISERVLLTERRCREKLGDDRGAARAERRLRAWAPEALSEPVVSPLKPR